MVLRGKDGPEFMKTVYGNLGGLSRRVLVGPGQGLDNAVVSVGNGRVLIVTVDPISAIPEFGMKLSGWLGVHLIASDFTASGVDPEFATFSYNFPPEMSGSEKEEFVRSVGSECKKLGVTIVGGNTGSYPGAGFTVIGMGSMFGLTSSADFITPSMARPGDVVLMTKSAAIEATGSLALSFREVLEEKVGARTAAQARAMIHQCSTVEDARVARGAGLGRDGVTSMHDATEGGVLGALHEMSSASGHALEVDLARIPVTEAAARTCEVFGLDPLATMGEGALLMTCRKDVVPALERLLNGVKIPITEIGKVKTGEGLTVRRGERTTRFAPSRDRYWRAYSSFSRRGRA